MARKRNAGLMAILMLLPWWVSASIGMVVFSTFKWITPALWANNAILKGLAIGLQPVAWIFSIPFAIVSIIAFLLQFGRKRQPEKRQWAPKDDFIRTRPKPSSGLDQPESDIYSAWMKQPVTETPKQPSAWSLDVLRSIEWKRFEELCAEIYTLRGFRTELQRYGADGGIDIRLYQEGTPVPVAIIQCKAWNSSQVGVKPIRELLGVMVHNKIDKGIFITTNDYTQEAIDFASQNPIALISGKTMIEDISYMPDDAQKILLQFATAGDYTTPTCPSCGIKLVKRTGNRGAFWGCLNYPKCRYVAKSRF